ACVSATGSWRIGVDTGGTFTDLVAVGPGGDVRLQKVSSTPAEPARATFDALDRSGVDPAGDVDSFIMGTTIATNALIQRRGAPTVLITTAGFEDVLYIQRIDRQGLYDLQWVKAEPYVRRDRVVGVRERILADGSVRTSLRDDELARVVAEVRRITDQHRKPAVAVSLLFSYVNPSHEQALRAALTAALGDVPVSISSEVAPIWREYERSNSTVMDAYVKPIVSDFAGYLVRELDRVGMEGWCGLLRSNGGQVAIADATSKPVEIVLSGLAAGMISGAHFAGAVDTAKAVTLDMGGTSADVGVIVDGELQFSGLFEVEFGLPLALPILDVTTIGAGGGSIASIDSGGLLKVGPESAGADPGPACYGLGGEAPTVTDANVVMGRLDPGYFLGGRMSLDADRAHRAIAALADRLGLSPADTADAIVSVSIENMDGAMRLVTVDRGLDYREFDLVAYGGAGPLHAVEIARRMGMNRVIVPPNPGLVSAYGTIIADQRVDRRITLVRRLDHTTSEDLPAVLGRLADDTVAELRSQLRHPEAPVDVTTYVACRYVGQNYEQEIRTEFGHVDRSFELAVPIGPEAADFVARLAASYHATHKAAYGYEMRDQAIQSVYLGATALSPAPDVLIRPYAGGGGGARPRTRRVLATAGRWVDACIVNRDALPVGEVLDGPAVIEEADSTTWVPPEFSATVHESQCLIIARDAAGERP
ncbi:MAG: hydantoinase/oxoprolinase family protein, partial [Acidimicrobiia bacterium]|nr:hydantoinase/oxoprolinase family protein [Acidimicrobiia bacterium]